jgi:hypothetical protein
VYKLFHLLNIFRLSDDRLKIDEESDNDDQKEVVNKIKELLNTKIKETANDVDVDGNVTVDVNVDDSTTTTTVKDEEETTTTLLPTELVRAADTTGSTTSSTTSSTTTTVYTTEYVPPPPPPEEPQQPAANPGIFARVGEFFSSITNFGFRPVVIGRK